VWGPVPFEKFAGAHGGCYVPVTKTPGRWLLKSHGRLNERSYNHWKIVGSGSMDAIRSKDGSTANAGNA